MSWTQRQHLSVLQGLQQKIISSRFGSKFYIFFPYIFPSKQGSVFGCGISYFDLLFSKNKNKLYPLSTFNLDCIFFFLSCYMFNCYYAIFFPLINIIIHNLFIKSVSAKFLQCSFLITLISIAHQFVSSLFFTISTLVVENSLRDL